MGRPPQTGSLLENLGRLYNNPAHERRQSSASFPCDKLVTREDCDSHVVLMAEGGTVGPAVLEEYKEHNGERCSEDIASLPSRQVLFRAKHPIWSGLSPPVRSGNRRGLAIG